jgi:ATP-dependent helicase/nuclease subunit B
MTAPLIQLFTPGTVLVAAGQRLARHLSQQYARESRAQGLEVWETPVILTFGAWLSRLWLEAIERGADERLLLSTAQEVALWERVIGESEPAAELLSPTATAGLARSAWSLMHAWELPRSELDKAGHEDVQVFAGWEATFDKLCHTHRWLDGARLAGVLSDLIVQKRVRVPARVVLAGFDELTPQQRRLFETLGRAGCELIELAQSTESSARVTRVALASAEDEILAAAQWARAKLQKNPTTRIGVLAPDLSSQNRTIRRVFDDVLLPQSALPGHEELARPYNVSLGEPLAAQPLVTTALAILELAHGGLPLDRLSELLRSPYLAGAELEMTRRALLDVELRCGGDMRISVSALARMLDHLQEGTSACPILRERLKRFREGCATLNRPRLPSQWLTSIAQLLAAFGWPGDRSRSSAEHQAIEAWRELLSEFGALDPVLAPIRFGEALARLRRLARDTLFQRETPETPVQILGVLEASGLEFDALWVMGLHDEVWPAAPRPNPFLPVALQRARGLPHASAERELEFCTQLTQRLLRSAPEVVLSHPLREDDRDLRPSPLIRTIAEVDAADVLSAKTELYRERIHLAARQETIVDFQLPALAVGAYVDGGTSLFRSQSACPFRGGAEFRLGAFEFPEPEPGLNAADRGTLVHAVLARIWQELGSHAGLIAMPAETLTQRLEIVAGDEIEKLKRRRPETVTERVATLERERLVALITEWLQLEKLRAPFTVRREEARTQLSVAGLVTQACMDRVDQLLNGGLVVIDYKTGNVRLNDWFGERPAEPQLPLYALYGVPTEQVEGLFFARVCRGESGFVGMAFSADVVPGIAAYRDSKQALEQGPWENLFQGWDRKLVGLAQEIGAGQAQVSPRDPKACQYCHLHAFCRIYERRARLLDGGEESDD